jgi:hypothetical protein
VFVFDVAGFEGFRFHDQFEEETTSCEDVDCLGLVFTLAYFIGEFWCVALDGADPIAEIIGDGL